MSLPLAAVNDR